MPAQLTKPIQDAPEAPAQPSQLDQILSMLQDLTQRQTTLEVRMQQQAEQLPQYRPITHAGRRPRVTDDDLAGLGPGQEREGDSQLPVGVNGRQLDANLLRHFGQLYHAGQQVQIRRDAVAFTLKNGEPTLWGTLLDKAGVRGVGVVLRTCFVGHRGEWKYRVRVPGFTRKQGDGFLESMLEPL